MLSVPHSGTRSLIEHLNPGSKRNKGAYFHFGRDDDDILELVAEGGFRANIPVRDPVEVAISWESRYSYGGSHTPEHMHLALQRMIDWKRDGTTYWHTKDLPVWEGKGLGHPAAGNPDEILKLQRIQEFMRWYNETPSAQEFYQRFFPTGLWWM